jgi:putative aldouronate transport system substrate-binding protein
MKRFLIILSLLILAGAVAWAAGSTEPEADRPMQDGVYTETTQTIEPLMKYDPPIDMTVYKSADTFFGYTEDQTPSDNDVYSLIQEVVGINTINEAEVSVAAYDQKVRLAITSNDLPDMVATSAADFDTMIRNDMLHDLAPYIERYMTPALREAYFSFDGALIDPVARGEAIYGLPATSNVQGNLRVAWIRKDWLEAVGRDTPTTMEELIDLARAFALEDPDGNGEDDTFGIAMADDLFGLVNTFEIVSNAYGYYPGRLIRDDQGNVVNGSLDPGLKDVLQVFQDLSEEGVLDPEWAVKDFQQVDEDVAAGKIGLWLGVFWKPVDPGMAQTYRDGVEWEIIQIPGSETQGGAYRPFVPFPVGAYYGVSKDYPHPEALVILLNHWFTTNSDATAEWAKGWRRISNVHAGIPINNWSPVQLQDPAFFDASPLERALADPDFDPDNPAYQVHGQAYDILAGNVGDDLTRRQFRDIFLGAVARMEEYPQQNYVFPGYFGPSTATQQRQGSILGDRESETITGIIAGRIPVSGYDDFIAEYRRLGGDAILEEINEAVSASE